MDMTKHGTAGLQVKRSRSARLTQNYPQSGNPVNKLDGPRPGYAKLGRVCYSIRHNALINWTTVNCSSVGAACSGNGNDRGFKEVRLVSTCCWRLRWIYVSFLNRCGK